MLGKKNAPIHIKYFGKTIRIGKPISLSTNSIVFECAYEDKNCVIKFFRSNKKDRYYNFKKEKEIVDILNKEIGVFTPTIIEANYPSNLNNAIKSYNTAPFEIIETGSRLNYEGLNLNKKIDIILEICQRIEAMHNLNYHHLDIKPENILLFRNRLSLIDFSTSDVIGPPVIEPDKVGSYGTMAPEMRLFGLELNNYDYSYADIYSLGKTIWLILSGKGKKYSQSFTTYDFNNPYCNLDIGVDNPVVMKYIGNLIKKATLEKYNRRITLDEIKNNFIYLKDYLLKDDNFVKLEKFNLLLELVPENIDIAIINDENNKISVLKELDDIIVDFSIKTNLGQTIYNKSKTLFKLSILDKKMIKFEIDNLHRQFFFLVEDIHISKNGIILTNAKETEPFDYDDYMKLSRLDRFEIIPVFNDSEINSLEKNILVDCNVELNRSR